LWKNTCTDKSALQREEIVKSIPAAVLCTLLFFHSFSYASDPPPPTLAIRMLSADITQKIVIEAVSNCARRGYQVSAAVVDRSGNLAAFSRHPLAGPHTVKVSQRKAYTSATLQTATSGMSHRPDLSFAPEILLIVGGVPIKYSGHFYGGAAVAGTPPEVDEQCAAAGLAAVSEIMDFVE
jgi:uncharacterized protein GlcG (DUF336 family)